MNRWQATPTNAQVVGELLPHNVVRAIDRRRVGGAAQSESVERSGGVDECAHALIT